MSGRSASGELVSELPQCTIPSAISYDGSLVFVAVGGISSEEPHVPTPRETTRVLEVDSGRGLLDLGDRLVASAAFNPHGEFEGGRYLATNLEVPAGGDGDCAVELYDLETGEMIGSLSVGDVGIQFCSLGISFDPTGRFLAGGSLDGWVWVLDLAEVVSGANAADAIVFNELAHTGIVPLPSITSDGILATSGCRLP